jgi:alanyl-tRNA synthetase
VIEKVASLVEEKQGLELAVNSLRREILSMEVEKMLASKEMSGPIPCLIRELAIDLGQVKTLADLLFAKVPTLAVAFFTAEDEKCSFFFKLSADLVKKGLRADEWMKACAPIVGGKGGGKADVAQGGGTHPKKVSEALNQARQWIEMHSTNNS